MLGKLLKYDWKSFWKVPAIINISLIIITIAGAISLVSPLWKETNDIIMSLMLISVSFYCMAIFAGSIAVSVYIAVRYYKNVYTDEGYLTHTLPVKPRDIILSKLLVGFIWTVITGLVISFSILLLLGVAAGVQGDYDLIQELAYAFREIAYFFKTEIGISPAFFLFTLLVYIIVSNVFSILMLLSSVALGQLFPKHKVMGAVIWYIVEYIIVQCGSILFVNLPTQLLNSRYNYMDGFAVGRYFMSFIWGITVIIVILSVIMFCITELIMRKNLNLD